MFVVVSSGSPELQEHIEKTWGSQLRCNVFVLDPWMIGFSFLT